MARSDVLKEYYSLTCGVNQEPEAYISKLDDLRYRIAESGGQLINDNSFVTQILNSVPSKVDVIEMMEYKKLANDQDAQSEISLSKLTEMLSLRYQRYQGNRNSNREHNTSDTALFATSSKRFKGMCYNSRYYLQYYSMTLLLEIRFSNRYSLFVIMDVLDV
jgi:hypothetical protein